MAVSRLNTIAENAAQKLQEEVVKTTGFCPGATVYCEYPLAHNRVKIHKRGGN